jgi:hypothetical protein
MESISKRTGKKFTGKFASTAVRLGLATPSGEDDNRNDVLKTKLDELNELSKQSANESLTDEEKSELDAKIVSIKEEIEKIESDIKATEAKQSKKTKAKAKTPAKTVPKKTAAPKEVKSPAKAKVEEKPAGNADKTIMVSDQVKEAVSLETKGTKTLKTPGSLKKVLTAKKVTTRKAKK